MAIRMPCSCGTTVFLGDASAGKTVTCPACGRSLAVPLSGISPAAPPKALAGAAPRKRAAAAAPPIEIEESDPDNMAMKVGLGIGGGVLAMVVIGIAIVLMRSPSSESSLDDPLASAKPQVERNDVKPVPPPPPPPAVEPKKEPPPPETIKPSGDKKAEKKASKAFLPVEEEQETTPERKVAEKKEEDKVDRTPKRNQFVAEKKGSLLVPLETLEVEEATIPHRVRRISVAENTAPRKLKLAVSPAGSDNIAAVLSTLGIPFDNIFPDGGDWNAERFRPYDVVFMNCGGGGTPQVMQALRQYVENGGTLYASDLMYSNVLSAFPELQPPTIALGYPVQDLTAQIVDTDLREFLGAPTIALKFNGPGWMPAAFNREKVTTYIEGNPTMGMGGFNFPKGFAPFNPGVNPKQPKTPVKKKPATPAANAKAGAGMPLLIKYRHQRGTVIYTSFHNNSQVAGLQKKLLEYLVFSAVTAKAESNLADIIAGVGFLPQNMKTVQISTGQTTAMQNFDHPGGGFQVAVGFENVGAKLKLTVISPTGQKLEHEESGVFLMEVPAAPAGAWTYNVTGVSVPFQNFPIVLAVAKSK